jgi:hypothetical protein
MTAAPIAERSRKTLWGFELELAVATTAGSVPDTGVRLLAFGYRSFYDLIVAGERGHLPINPEDGPHPNREVWREQERRRCFGRAGCRAVCSKAHP